jgi:hypothetical protein
LRLELLGVSELFQMPIFRYFAVVGIGLLALLFLIDAYFPSPPAYEPAAISLDKSMIRIKTKDLLPAPVIIGGSGLVEGPK